MSELNGGAPAPGANDGGNNPNNAGGAPAPAAGGTPAAGAAPAGGEFKWPDQWQQHLPDDLKGDKSLEKFKDIPSLAKSYIHAQKAIGKNQVVIPDPKFATKEEMKEFYGKLGLPGDIKDYTIKPPEGISAEFADTFKAKAMELNILPSQAEQLLGWYAETDKSLSEQASTASIAQMQEKLDAYKKTQGEAYPATKAYAQKFLDEFGSDGLKAKVASFGGDPDFIDTLARAGRALFSDDDIKLGGEGRDPGALTPDQAQERWKEIDIDKSHAYWNSKHPEHKKAQAEVQKLFNQMHPS